MRIAGSQVRLTTMSLKEFIVIAYGVKAQQTVKSAGSDRRGHR